MEKQGLLIHEIFAQAAGKYPDKIALQIKRDSFWQRFTYKDIEALSEKVSAFLIKQGFKPQEFAALILENRPEWPIIYLGIVRAGLGCVPIDPDLSAAEIKNLLSDCVAKVVFLSHHILQQKLGQPVRNQLAAIVALDLDTRQEGIIDFAQIKDAPLEDTEYPQVKEDALASLIYTSGTTAKPKGVILTHYNLCSDFKSIEKMNICYASDNFLSVLPLFHTYAFMVTLLLPLSSGATVTYCASLKAEDLTAVIKEARATVLVGVPQLFSLLHKKIFAKLNKIPFFLRPLFIPFVKIKVRETFGKSLRLFVCGGARLEPIVGAELSNFFKFIEGYGLTETSPVVTFNPPQRQKFGSVGKPIPGVEVRIFEPDLLGVGEVIIRAANVMLGYFKQPDLTQETIKDGWLHTGDLGYLDKDGYLFLTGRKKDVIVLSSGKNIYPEELEEHYVKSAYIKEICILSKREEKFGKEVESLYAVIVPNFEYFRQHSEVNIQERLRQQLNMLSVDMPSYKHIMGFIISKEEFPRTRLRKIIRYKVQQKYIKEKFSVDEAKGAVLSEEDRSFLETDLAKKVINYFSKELKRQVFLDNHLEIDLGIDSLSRVELAMGLEAILGVRISDEFIYTISTVRELIFGIQDILSAGIKAGERLEDKKQWSQILSQAPAEVAAKIDLSSGFAGRLITFICRCAFLFVFKLVWSLKVKGRENLPKEGPFILCPNHASYLDGFAVFCALPLKNIDSLFFLGLADIFERPVISWVAKTARLISIDPAMHLTQAMQAASLVLRNKKVICLFPEGSRSYSTQVQEFKKGVGILIKELDVRVIPVYIKGSHYSWPREAKFPRLYPLEVVFGKPKSAAELGSDYETIAKTLHEEVVALSSE